MSHLTWHAELTDQPNSRFLLPVQTTDDLEAFAFAASYFLETNAGTKLDSPIQLTTSKAEPDKLMTVRAVLNYAKSGQLASLLPGDAQAGLVRELERLATERL